MPSRRSHTKSHHGCRQCKSRRVKCDETAPQCQRCVKRHITCSFVTDGIDGFVETSTTPTQSQQPLGADLQAPTMPNVNGYHAPEAGVQRLDLNHGSIHQRLVSSISPVPPAPTKVLDLLDLELIHQYCTRTYMSISSRLSTHAVWRDKVFKEGLRHEFLLHGIMATAALHKASSFKENSDEYRKYASAGLIHQNAALQEYSPLTASPTPDNANALFALSMLLTLITFAIERLPDDMKNSGSSYLTLPEDNPEILLPHASSTRDFIMVISTLRGILLVIRQTQQYFEGDISEFMRYPMKEDLPPHPHDVADVFEQLANTAINYRPVDLARTGMAPDNLSELLYRRVIHLRDVTRCRSVIEWDSHIFSFLTAAEQEYIDLIKRGEPMALVIFAHWSACFRCMDHHWWAVGWGEKLVVDISRLIDMNQWGKAMEWPLLQCGRTLADYPVTQSWATA